MANITVVGNLTRPVDLQFGESGRAFARTGLAENHRKRQPDGTWVDGGTSFYNVTVFGETAVNAAASLGQGSRVVVVGRLEIRQYDKKDGSGSDHSADIVADELSPSLRWATAEVSKVSREQANGAASSEAPEDVLT